MIGDERLSTEYELVLNCIGPTYDSDAADRTRELVRHDVDWNRVYEIARWHQIRPLLVERLDETDGSPTADHVESELRADSRTVAQRNLLASDQLRTVVERLHDADVRVLPFKGPAIATDVYDDISRREFSDLDLLVSRADVPTAMDVLESSGYEWEYDVPRLDDGAILGGRFTPPLTQEYRMVHGENGTVVELRWQVGESGKPFGISFEELWHRARETSFRGTDVRFLDTTDRVLVLTYHGTKHHWQRLKWLCDVSWLLHRRHVDWDELLARARRNGTERRLLLGVGLSKQIFGVTLPADVADRISSDDDVSVLLEQTVERVFGRPTPSIGYWELKRYTGRSDDSRLGTVRTLGHSLLEPKMHEYEYYPLSRHYHALYYLFRPIRVLVDSIRPSRET